VVVGGGLAGVAAAVQLADRGVRVTLLEAEHTLGGRVSAWDDQRSDGDAFQMGRGFHAFFRQYYNLRDLLRRLDPGLGMLSPVPEYPIYGRDGQTECFGGLPKLPPFNLIELARRTRYLTFRDLLRVNARQAMAMLSFDPVTTYAEYDHTTARQYLDSLRFPKVARAMLFDVFAHSFFNSEDTMSAAELIMMFHFYFTGAREGLLFDVMNKPFSTGLWRPMAQHLESQGVRIERATRAERVVRRESGFAVEAVGRRFESDMVVLALNIPALQKLVDSSEGLDAPGFRSSVRSLSVTGPFVVWRRWLDRPARPQRHAFAGTNQLGRLDNISFFELFEDESRQWTSQHGGSVIELHAYALTRGFDPATLREELWEATLGPHPELRGARVIDERFLVREDCPAFAPGSHALRPSVASPFRGLALAGDFVKLPMPCALMERATASGMLAANHLLEQVDVCGAPIRCVPLRGLFAHKIAARPHADADEARPFAGASP
jgi:isorenieratene synthase